MKLVKTKTDIECHHDHELDHYLFELFLNDRIENEILLMISSC